MTASPSKVNTAYVIEKLAALEVLIPEGSALANFRRISAELTVLMDALAPDAVRSEAFELAAKWLDFYDGTGGRRAEAIRSLKTSDALLDGLILENL